MLTAEIIEYWAEVEKNLISPNPRNVLENVGLMWTRQPMALSKEFGSGYNLHEVVLELKPDNDESVVCDICSQNIPMDCDGMHQLKRVEL